MTAAAARCSSAMLAAANAPWSATKALAFRRIPANRMDSGIPPSPLQLLDQPCIDQQTVEPPRFRAAIAGIEDALAATQDVLLLHEGRIERQPSRLQDHQRQIRRVERVGCR